ncbi:MAG TPA: DUF1460 domain-containing protein [Myxococcales bacterium]|jgi:hypothetical protein|nr:DUF1460 domain-containing protein [Myxococcales bacterium]
MTHRLIPTFALLFAAPAPLPAASVHTQLTRFCDAPKAEVPRLVEAIARLETIGDRLLSASERFLGVRYQSDPLGEGPDNPPDEDPRVRFDAVDCTTFVETVIALARSRGGADLEPVLDDLRYDGEVGYANRNHFFAAQWLRANVRKGYVRDVTGQLAPGAAVTHTKVITPDQWRARALGTRIRLPEERAPIGSFELRYVPLDKVAGLAPRIPSGTLLAVVREDRPLVPFMVTHLGFIVQTSKGTVVRHAGRDLYGQVIDEQLEHFLRRNMRYRRRRVLGFQFLEVLDAPATTAEPKPAGL